MLTLLLYPTSSTEEEKMCMGEREPQVYKSRPSVCHAPSTARTTLIDGRCMQCVATPPPKQRQLSLSGGACSGYTGYMCTAVVVWVCPPRQDRDNVASFRDPLTAVLEWGTVIIIMVYGLGTVQLH